jgi:hypothetical protein
MSTTSFVQLLGGRSIYSIKEHTRKQAKRLGVTVKPSTTGNKKLDVYKNGQRIAQVGHIDYGDYPTYMQTRGKEFADRRRAAYKLRHAKDRFVRGSNGYYADQLLW